MKRFKDLNSEEKKRAVKHLLSRNLRDIRWNGAGQSEAVKQRLKEITTRIKFCGCGTCEYNLGVEIAKDNVIQEAQLEKSMKQAEEAFYPEDTDTIVKV
jgi:hypothetical protein